MTYAAASAIPLTPLVICNFSSPWSAFAYYRTAAGAGVPASQTGPAANQAQYYPFVVTTPATFTRGFWYNGATPANYGNACVGIYTPDGTRQATTGAVVGSGASVIQTAAFSANYTAIPGLYYMAIEFSASGITAILGGGGSTSHKQAGVYTQAVGSHPLPASATFATWSSQIVPLFGIAQTTFAI